MDYWLVAWRLLMSFILVLFFFQLSGSKRQFSQMTSFDLISNFLLSAVLGGFLFNPQTTWYGFMAVLSVYFALNWLVNYIAQHTKWGRGVIIGTPTVIISDGQVNIKNLRKINMTMTDFMSLLRTQDVRSLAEIKTAQIEVGGDLSIIRKGERNFAVALIEDGKINADGLRQVKQTRKWLMQQLKKQHISRIEEVFYAQLQKNDFYVVKFK